MGLYKGLYKGTIIKALKGDARRLDYGSKAFTLRHPAGGEDTSQALLTPPEDSGVHTTDAVNKDWLCSPLPVVPVCLHSRVWGFEFRVIAPSAVTILVLLLALCDVSV